jgi:SWIM/SEC-C metal-binding protein|tara:strand:+ start:1919 stop:2257 length:339 start_codon:yes stop_codon:yes gene_type:complete
MSKFFFKGRQDKRENHENHGYQPKGMFKPGSKKYPLELVVTSPERKVEVESIVDEHQLYANISVNQSEDAEENIIDLTGLLSKPKTTTVDKIPARNEPCSCGSGKKFKRCCA